MLKGEGSKVLFEGVTTDKVLNYYGWGDETRELKFVVCKGYIDDWCIYLEDMNKPQSFEEVRAVGNKLGYSSANELIKCDRHIWDRYRL